MAAPLAAAQPRFELELAAPEPLRGFLLRHLELQRYQALDDLQPAELDRLLAQAPDNLRELLATQGHFSPRVEIEAPVGATPRRIGIRVEPGPATRVHSVALTLREAAPDRLEALRSGWTLAQGQTFTQAAWDAAKAAGLRQLNERRHPHARLEHSEADIDPGAHEARLVVDYVLGPAVTLGGIDVQGHERYDPDIARRLARQAGLLPGTDYDLARLQAAQRRLTDSGYYESAFVYVDTRERDEGAPVVLQLREARRQKWVLGAGLSTDSGPRLSVEHTQHRVPGLDWRALTRLRLERNNPLLQTDWTSPPDAQGWRWLASALAQRQNDGTQNLTSQRLRGGRSQDGEALDRSFYLQYDRAYSGGAAPQASISLNYAWSRVRFDDPLLPRDGHGLGVELGLGSTVGTGSHDPYLRARARWQGVRPLAARERGRLVLRLEGGAVLAATGAPVPETQRFLTGGDATVRGYGLRDIGVPQPGGGVAAGRYLGVGSLEWQRPLPWGNAGEWEHTVFIDAGGVTDRPAEFKAHVGVGSGLRYNSPVGPLQLDLAYGLDARRLRLHLSVGFAF